MPGTIIMTAEEVYAQSLQSLPDAKLIEDHYAAHYAIRNLEKARGLSEDALHAHEWTKARAPLLEAERRRRNLVLPSWAMVV